MARIEKTVFISYRRSDVYTALAVYQNLKNQGMIFSLITEVSPAGLLNRSSSATSKRVHTFVLILTPTALDRCQ